MLALRQHSASLGAAAAALFLHGTIALAWLPGVEPEPPSVTMQVISVALLEQRAATNPQPVVEPVREPVKDTPRPKKPKPLPVTEQPVVKPIETSREEPSAEPEQEPQPTQAETEQQQGEDTQTVDAVDSVITPPIFDAAYLHNPPPRYPRIARRLHQEGTVELRVRVSPQGRATELEVARSSGVEVLDQAALEAVRRWQFVPAQRGETAVEAWVVVPVQFTLES